MTFIMRLAAFALMIYILLVTGLFQIFLHIIMVSGALLIEAFKIDPLITAVGLLAFMALIRLNNKRKAE